MKRLLSYLPLLGLVIGFFLLSLPEGRHSSSHNHLQHLLLTCSVFFIFLLGILKQKSFIHLSTKFQVGAVIILFLFLFLHATPAVLAFQSHHQSHSVSEHPCCASQTVNLVQEIKVIVVDEFFSLTIKEFEALQRQALTANISNKSPPSSIS